MAAVSDWADPNKVGAEGVDPEDTLGALSPGGPFNTGTCAALVQATNLRRVFQPFPVTLGNACRDATASTTVREWIRIVWDHRQGNLACAFVGPPAV